MDTPTGRQQWHTAQTLTDLGYASAAWLEGAITHQPAYFADAPNDETRPLIPHLARLNRAGYFTTDSQPGHLPTPDNNVTQRAYVAGFASSSTVEAVQAAILDTRLIALATPPGFQSALQIPVTLGIDQPFTWLGATLAIDDIVDYYGHDCPNAVQALATAWQLDVFDPEWGRNDLLWPRLDQALRGGGAAGPIGASPSQPDGS